VSGQLHFPAALPPGKEPPVPIGWVGPRAGLDDLEKRQFLNLPGLEFRSLSRPARSQSLYRLRYPSWLENTAKDKRMFVLERQLLYALVPVRAKLFTHHFVCNKDTGMVTNMGSLLGCK
jgi:hypothetical protein